MEKAFNSDLMPQCYLLSTCSGASLDQHSNNISLFALVEQVNIPPGAPPPPRNQMPLEVHAYFRVAPHEMGKTWRMRFVLKGPGGLETYSDPVEHRLAAARFRTRTLGLPVPPTRGGHELCVELCEAGGENWIRDRLQWPIAFVEAEQKPVVTH